MDNRQRDALLGDWLNAKKSLDYWKAKEIELRSEVTKEFFNPAEDEEGTRNVDLGNNYKLKGVFALSYKLIEKDELLEKAISRMEKLGEEAEYIIKRLIKWKPELSKTEYKNLPDKYVKILNSALEVKPSTPQISLIEPKVK